MFTARATAQAARAAAIILIPPQSPESTEEAEDTGLWTARVRQAESHPQGRGRSRAHWEVSPQKHQNWELTRNKRQR